MKPATLHRLVLTAGLLGLAAIALWFYFSRPAAKPTSAAAPAAAPVVTTAPVVAPPRVPPAENSPALRPTLEAARNLPDPRQRASEFGRQLLEWIDRDPAAALAYVRQLPPGAESTQGLLLVLEALGRVDPDRALTLARELVANREQRAIYSALFARMAAADPAGAVSRLALVPAGESRDHALRALADGWAGNDWPAALAWARQLEGADHAPAMESVLAALLPTDPLQAIDLARQTLAGAAFDRTLTAALQSLTRSSPAEAAALVSVLAPGEVQTQAALAVARALAAQNPGEALTWMKTLPAGAVQGLALGNILEVWTARDPAAAGQYVAQMPPGPGQEAAAVQLARVWGAGNPANAIAWAQSLAGDAARSGALVTIASAWAQRDPAAAVRWAAATPALAGEALTGALSYWVQQDAGATRNFVQTLAGDTQVRAAAAIAPALAQADPLPAIAWTQTLSEVAAREPALAAAYARWRLNAPAAAQAWLASADLPAATKARLLAGP